MDKERLEVLLDGAVSLVYEDITGSTNDDAKRLLAAGMEPPFLVVADEQTAGRGRRGNSFISPRGGIYMTLAVPVPDDGLELVTLFAVVCVCEVLGETFGVKGSIKWINDIYIDDCKLAGILVESFNNYLIIGIGINVLVSPDLPGNVQAASLNDYTNTPDLELFCASLAQRLAAGLMRGIDADETIDFCRENSVLIGREVAFELHGTTSHGIARGLAKNGALLVDVGDQRVVLTSAHCNVRIVGSC